jgi:hypothetical protein
MWAAVGDFGAEAVDASGRWSYTGNLMKVWETQELVTMFIFKQIFVIWNIESHYS